MPIDLGISGDNLARLRRSLNHLYRDPSVYTTHLERLVAGDLSFMAHDASLLKDMPSDIDSFFPSYGIFRNGTSKPHRSIIQLKMRRALMDMAAALDQMTGSTTFVAHIPSALEPGTPAQTEYLRAYVYAPHNVMREAERDGGLNPVPELVQTVIRELGPLGVGHFDRCRRRYHNTGRSIRGPKPKPLPIIEGMPVATPPGSARYIFYGQKTRPLPDPTSYFAGGSSPDIEEEPTRGVNADAGPSHLPVVISKD